MARRRRSLLVVFIFWSLMAIDVALTGTMALLHDPTWWIPAVFAIWMAAWWFWGIDAVAEWLKKIAESEELP